MEAAPIHARCISDSHLHSMKIVVHIFSRHVLRHCVTLRSPYCLRSTHRHCESWTRCAAAARFNGLPPIDYSHSTELPRLGRYLRTRDYWRPMDLAAMLLVQLLFSATCNTSRELRQYWPCLLTTKAEYARRALKTPNPPITTRLLAVKTVTAGDPTGKVSCRASSPRKIRKTGVA